MSKTCQKCRQTNPPQAAFCSNCASALPPSNNQPANPWNQPDSGGQKFARTANYSAGGAGEKAVMALVLGVAGFFCCSVFTAVPAIFIGWTELKAIKAGESSKFGSWCAMTGFAVGILTIVLHIGGIGLWILMFLVAAASDPYSGY